jgi:glycosyltransferase involved in cell wall biosynthesis
VKNLLASWQPHLPGYHSDDEWGLSEVRAPMNQIRKPRVAVVYHFFAHYRSPIMEMLLSCQDIDYFLVGDRSDPDNSVKPWQPPEEKLLFAPCIKVTSDLLWQKGLLGLAIRRDIDTIIFLGNANFLSTWLAALLARLMRKRVLFWTHGWLRREQGAKAIVRNLFYRLAHGLLLYGNRAKMFGIENGFAKDRMYVIYNSLDYRTQKTIMSHVTEDRIKRIREMFFSDSKIPLLIYTGRLIKSKGLALLLSAMSQLQTQGFKTSLLLVGDGPEQEPLTQLAKTSGLAVHFYGPCYDEHKLSELIMSANVTVAPGQVGLTAIHSLGYGTPVITHDDPNDQGPEWEAIVPGETGGIFKRGDIQDLARIIHKWCLHPWPDEDVRRQCKGVVDHFYNPDFQRRVINHAVVGLPAE